MRALATAGLAVVDVELIPTHGGSIRVWARPEESAGHRSERVADVLRIEEEAGLHQVDGYLQLRPRTEAVRHELCDSCSTDSAEGKRVVGYGAPGKGNTLLNYCGIRSDLLEYTVDRNPYKHGRFTPGTRIPIHDPAQIDKDRPDVVLALPWNLETELTEQLAYIARVGRPTRLSPAHAAYRRDPELRKPQEVNTMKVVLFCGGYGMRMRNSSDDGMPKADADGRSATAHLACDALLRPLRPQGIHPVPRLRRGAHQELLPDVSGSRIERLRDARRPGRADAFRHQ